MTKKVSSNIYDDEYFLRFRGGSDEFLKSKGKDLYDAHNYAINLAKLKANDKILDIGCGCGEIALNAAKIANSILAIDYSKSAINLALQAMDGFEDDVKRKVKFVNSDIETYELPQNHFDTVFFLDVIEHLNQFQIDIILPRIYNALVKGGKLIIHTWPNRWHRQITYPLSYHMGKIAGKKRPKDPRKKHERLMHVSEQSPLELKTNLRKAGFKTKVFLRFNEQAGEKISERLYFLIHSIPPFKWFFCDQIWVIGIK
jgi:ubiquinone/menaquinone biosynthesis C-methylase UbiE